MELIITTPKKSSRIDSVSLHEWLRCRCFFCLFDYFALIKLVPGISDKLKKFVAPKSTEYF